MSPRTYEIAFAGEAGEVLRAEFDDCDVSVGSGVTSLRAVVPDAAALAALVQRLAALRLEVVHAHLVATSPGTTTNARRRHGPARG